MPAARPAAALAPAPPPPSLTGPAGRPYRPGVGIMLANPSGNILIGKRVDMVRDAWQMPQGGLDHGESADDALWREMQEEIGTVNAGIVARARNWMHYDFPPEIAPTLWGGRFSGQIQLWYLLRFAGDDGEIVLDTHHPEFSEVRWVPPAQLPDMVIWFKRDSYLALLREFAAPLATLPG